MSAREEELAIIRRNIEECLERGEREQAKRRGHFAELCTALGRGEPISATPRVFFEEAARTLAPLLLSSPSPLPALDRARLIEHLWLYAEQLFGRPLSACDIQGTADPLPSVRRLLALSLPPGTAAARAFFPLFPEAPTVIERQRLSALLDELESRDADYAVLPLAEGGVPRGDTLSAMESLALSLNATATVTAEREELTLALVSRESRVLPEPSRIFFGYEPPSGEELGLLLEAATHLSLFPLSLTGKSAALASPRLAVQLLFGGSPRAIGTLLLYFSLFTRGTLLYGIYPDLSNR